MRNLNKFLALGVCGLFGALCANAEVKLPQILSDGMVVQRGKPVVLWGTADPGETVSIKAERQGKSKSYKQAKAQTVADADGKWLTTLPAMTAGAPYTITVNDITLTDVLPGDVYLCSGQSNMELPVRRVTDMFADEIAAYENPQIREFHVPEVVEFHSPLADVNPTQWKPCTQDNVMNYSATGYFFAKALNEKTGVPVGIINSCWGGTPVEAWISEEALAPFPRAINEKKLYENDAYREHIKRLEGENYAWWNRVLDTSDPGMTSEVKWYAADLDDSQWPEVEMLSAEWASDGLNPINGSHWLRKHINLTAEQAAKDATVRMGCIVDADSVYVNGVFVGTTGYQYPPRIYKVPAGVLHEGDNTVTVRLISQNGLPHFVPEKPYKVLLGDEEVSLEGKWRYHLGTPMVHGPGMEFYCYKPVVLYNAMIAPFVNLPIDGVVWYQGESNVGRWNEYSALLETLMADWRAKFRDPEMPFYIVELADFLHPSDAHGRAQWAEMRKQQAKAAADTPGATLIKNQDLGEWNDIHPLNKKVLGERLADAVTSK